MRKRDYAISATILLIITPLVLFGIFLGMTIKSIIAP